MLEFKQKEAEQDLFEQRLILLWKPSLFPKILIEGSSLSRIR